MAFVTLNTGDEISLGAGTHTIDGTGKVTFTSTSAQATYAGAGGAADTVAVVGASTDYNASKDGTNLVLTHKTTGKTITIASGTTADTVTFSNGSLTLQYVTGTGIKLGTQVVSNTTPAAISDTPTGAGTSTGTGTTAGQTFSLTTATEAKALSAGNDTVDGATVLDSIWGDTIIDSSATDADVANITVTTATGKTKPVISYVETINLTDKYGTVNFDASSVNNGTITVSTEFGTTGAVQNVDGSKGLAVKAGANVTTLEVDAIQKNASVTLTSAVTALALKGAATAGSTDDAATIVLAGNTVEISKDTTMVETLTINSSGAANTVTLATGLADGDLTKVTATGDKDLTIKVDAVDIKTAVTFADSTTAGVTTLELVKDAGGAAVDLTKVAFDKIKLNTALNAGDSLKLADNATLVVAKDIDPTADATDIDLVLTANTGATTVNLDLAATIGATDADAFIDATSFTTVNLSSSATSAVAAKIVADATDTIKVSGNNNITLNTGSVAIVDATGYTGKLTANLAAAGITKATGGNGNDSFIVADAAAYEIKGGSGNDTVKIAGNTDISALSVTLDAIEVLNLDALLTVNQQQVTGKNWVIQDQDGTTATKGLTVKMNDLLGAGVDLSGSIAGTATASITVTGTTAANNIVGSVFADSITTDAGNDTVNGGAGNDKINATGGGNNQLTGGAGDDTFILKLGSVVDYIVDFTETDAVTDVIQLGATNGTVEDESANFVFVNGLKSDLITSTEQVTIDGTTTLAAAAAAAVTASGHTASSFDTYLFNWKGAQYIFVDAVIDTATWGTVNGNDVVVKVTGLTDATLLTTANFAFDLV